MTLHTQDGKARVSEDFVKIIHQQLMLYKDPLAQLTLAKLSYQILSVGVDEALTIYYLPRCAFVRYLFLPFTIGMFTFYVRS